jgi:hypothetical protein
MKKNYLLRLFNALKTLSLTLCSGYVGVIVTVNVVMRRSKHGDGNGGS